MTDWLAAPTETPEAVKACCVTAYESDWLPLLLGDSWHPGGLALTLRAGERLELRPGLVLLDVACGRGASAIALAQRFGCRVQGIDLSAANIEAARAAARAADLSDLVTFEVGDAERLPLAGASVDALLCECAFCTFPTKTVAAGELARVLRPAGALCLADVTRDGPLPAELDSLLARVACLADARSIAGYASILEGAGLALQRTEGHPAAVRELLGQIRLKLLAAEVAAGLGKLALSRDALREAKSLLRSASRAVEDGALGYALLLARPSKLG